MGGADLVVDGVQAQLVGIPRLGVLLSTRVGISVDGKQVEDTGIREQRVHRGCQVGKLLVIKLVVLPVELVMTEDIAGAGKR